MTPIRLYYMTEARWAKKILQEQRFKLSRLNDLNDPFEFIGACIGEKQARKVAKVLHDHWHKNIGILCTGTSYESPVMWAHYGHKHHGVCLGFDFVVDDERHWPSQVKYEPNRIKGLFDSLGPNNLMTERQFELLLTTKFKDWEYEKEWRLFANLEERNAEDGLYYLKFEPHIQLREVILGARCKETVKDFAALVPPPKQPVEVFKLRGAFNSFAMVRQKQISPIFVRPKKTKPKPT
ncbi:MULTISPECIES: DUF2971 domain-containing protein [unclassified Acidovorax]|uniref:DUF2971 domain-containing protein n=1 Tax=unclassified Acidovorax TaxID=2684926 RepID=UPI000EF9A24A|nr:DUF2971 domain-containing protein [Acidovorax sp. 100]RMA59446.1 hypothetical protein C8C96_0452 [Acidovorax sp. 100]